MPHLPTKAPIQPIQKNSLAIIWNWCFPLLQSKSEDTRTAEAAEWTIPQTYRAFETYVNKVWIIRRKREGWNQRENRLKLTESKNTFIKNLAFISGRKIPDI